MSAVIWQPALSAEAESRRGTAEEGTRAGFAPDVDRDQRYPWEIGISTARLMLYEAAAAKLHGPDVAQYATDSAVRIWWGLGYCKPNVVERLDRDQRILEIYEGTSQIRRLVVARAVRKEAETALGQLAEVPAKRSA